MALHLHQTRPYLLFAALSTGALLTNSNLFKHSAKPTSNSPVLPAPAAASVTAARPVVRTLVEWKEYTGRLDSNRDVEIRARVSGYLEAIHFTEGQSVNAGDLLFTIDQRPFEAELASAKAALSQSRAALKFAESNRERAKTLLGQRAIAQEELDQRNSVADQARANVQVAEAALRTAELNLNYTEIHAPISGVVGEHRVGIGNLINGGNAESTLLTTIVPQNPIYVYFDLDEASQLSNLRRQSKGEMPGREGGLPVELELLDESGFPHKGVIDFIDNRLNSNTATLRVRGKFDNAGGLLAPGLFARVRVPASSEYEAMLIPDAAIGTSQSVRYVWVLGPDDQARQQEIVLGPLVDGKRIVRSGLEAEDRIVVNGIQLVRPGAPLKVAMEDSSADSSKSAVALR